MPVHVDLPAPEAIWSMLAAWAAIEAATVPERDGDRARAPVAPNRAHHDDGGGSGFDFVILEDGRAAIVGTDRDEALFGGPSGRAGLVAAGAPEWWLDAVPPLDPDPLSPGSPEPSFAYGFDRGSWSGVGHSPGNIVEHALGPGDALTIGSAVSSMIDWAEQACCDQTDDDFVLDESAIVEFFAAGPEVDDELLERVLGGDYGDLRRGVRTARGYRRQQPSPRFARPRVWRRMFS